MPTLEDIPLSPMLIACRVCQAPQRVVVCFCREDICLRCLLSHQKICAFAQASVIRQK